MLVLGMMSARTTLVMNFSRSSNVSWRRSQKIRKLSLRHHEDDIRLI